MPNLDNEPGARNPFEVVKNIKEVARWHMRGMTNAWIAQKLGLSTKTIGNYVRYIDQEYRDLGDPAEYLKKYMERTAEELEKLALIDAEAYQLLDWCSKTVVKTSQFGDPIPERDLQTGEEIPGKFQIGPNKPGYIPTILGQLTANAKLRAELLRLLGPKVDVSVNLEMQLKVQERILTVIRETDPALYNQLYRELKAMTAGDEQVALNSGEPDIIDASFKEVENELVEAD